MPWSMLMVSVYDVVHSSVAVPPSVMVAGSADRLTVGRLFTVTVTFAVTAL